MKLSTIVAALVCLSRSALALWPAPQQFTMGSSALSLASDFRINIAFQSAPADLHEAVERTHGFLYNDKMERLVVGRGTADAESLDCAELPGLTLNLVAGGKARPISEEATLELGTRNEAYTLTIPVDGSAASLTANSTLGLFRGLTTFSQLWYTHGSSIYTVEAPITINDAPAFPYRGFLLDTARNFFPKQDIKRTLDAMSWVKINTLHWHIVDSQSFALDLEEFPELAREGAYNQASKYTTSDIQEIVKFANARGIDVIFEIDTPGHTSIIHKSHPEFVACFEAAPWFNYANEPPAGQLRLTSQPVIDFTSKLFTSLLSKVPGKYFSTGGDEINTRCYQEDPVTSADLAAKGQTFEQALDHFTKETHNAILKLDKTPVVWQEMVLDHQLTLDPKTIVMVWISSNDVKAVADKGFRIVHAPSDYFYLDCGGGGWVGKNPNGNSWCDPFKTWQKSYSFNPLAGLTPAQAKLVLGGQQSLWTEQTDPSNLDSIAWPRAASSAEVFWTGTRNGTPLDGTEALPRLHDLRYRMVQRGVRAIALQPEWCALRPHACDL